jgi:Uma2 family endonuclease
MTTSQRLMTAEELLRLLDDGQRHELIAGELTTMPPSGAEHGRVAVRFTSPLSHYVATHRLGEVFAAETGFLLARDPDTVRAPDVAFVSRERVAEAGTVTGYWPGAPDLAVEVILPNDLNTEVEKKVATWLAHGTRMVLVLNPRRRTVAAHRPGADMRHLTVDDTLDGEDVVPGWTVPVRELFATVVGRGS